jgi:hypothetical protein
MQDSRPVGGSVEGKMGKEKKGMFKQRLWTYLLRNMRR